MAEAPAPEAPAAGPSWPPPPADGAGPLTIDAFGCDTARPRPKRSEYVPASLMNRPIVIDNGSHYCRAGWAGEVSPRVEFRSLVSRPRSRHTGEVLTVVGDYDTANAVKIWDLSRGVPKSAFEDGVVMNYDTQESVLDYSFECLGLGTAAAAATGLRDHPLILTECPLNPPSARAKMLELCFEAYELPSVTFGADVGFAYGHYRGRVSAAAAAAGPQQAGLVEALADNLLLLAPGHAATHAVPVVGGRVCWEAAVRLPVGGHATTEYLQRLLATKHESHEAHITYSRAEELKERYGRVEPDYGAALTALAGTESLAGTASLSGTPPPAAAVIVQLPFAAQDGAAEAIAAARDTERRAAAAARLRAMAASRKTRAREEAAAADAGGDAADGVGEGATPDDGGGDGHSTEPKRRPVSPPTPPAPPLWAQDPESALCAAKEALAAANRAAVDAAAAVAALSGPSGAPGSTEHPDPYGPKVPDSALSTEQLRERKRLRTARGAELGRVRARQVREEGKAKACLAEVTEAAARAADPEGYLQGLQSTFSALKDRAAARRKRRLEGESAADRGGAVGAGDGKRGTEAQRQRMKLLAEAAFAGGAKKKGATKADRFGASDADWAVYKQMDKRGGEDSEAERDEEMQLGRLETKLKALCPAFVAAANGDAPRARRLGATDFQLELRGERARAPELLFQPSLAGLESAGLAEVMASLLGRVSRAVGGAARDRLLRGGALIVGGGARAAGLSARVEAEMRRLAPLEQPAVRTFSNPEPQLDAWRGAAFPRTAFAATVAGAAAAVTRAEYYDHGPLRLAARKPEAAYFVGA